MTSLVLLLLFLYETFMPKIILASGLLFLFVSAIRSKSLDLTMKPSV